ncbi:MAG: HEPN domain-containing protein [Gemmataceae bacterium]|nr:HEPN domain-containing protein [Gemmataceae bacterium]
MIWSEFLTTAERLFQGTTEADWRSAVSQAYYAVFHFYRDFFLARGLNLGRSGQSHFNLYVGLLHCGLSAAARFGSRVDDLRSERTDADYDLNQSFTQSLAGTAVGNAKKLVNDFQTLLTTVPAAQIVAGAKKHLQTIGRVP